MRLVSARSWVRFPQVARKCVGIGVSACNPHCVAHLYRPDVDWLQQIAECVVTNPISDHPLIAQLVEHSTVDRMVPGSIPGERMPHTGSLCYFRDWVFGIIPPTLAIATKKHLGGARRATPQVKLRSVAHYSRNAFCSQLARHLSLVGRACA